MTAAELIEKLKQLPPELVVFIPGDGSCDGSWLKTTQVETKKIAPSAMMNRLYGVKPEEAYEFDTNNPPEWDALHAFDAVLIA